MKLVALLLLTTLAAAQQIQFDNTPHTTRQNVELIDDSITVDAAKPQDIELRFRVYPDLHINSHHPKDELLLPTNLKLDPSSGLQVLAEDYPPGSPFHLNIGAGETLDVYQDEFRIHLRLIAPRGDSMLSGTLHYQACDTASCFPPRALPVKVALHAKG